MLPDISVFCRSQTSPLFLLLCKQSPFLCCLHLGVFTPSPQSREKRLQRTQHANTCTSLLSIPGLPAWAGLVHKPGQTCRAGAALQRRRAEQMQVNPPWKGGWQASWVLRAPSSFRRANTVYSPIQNSQGAATACAHLLLLNIYEPIKKTKFITLALSQVWKGSNIYTDQKPYPLARSHSHTSLPPPAEDGAFSVLSPPMLFALIISLGCSQSSHLTPPVHSRSQEGAGGSGGRQDTSSADPFAERSSAVGICCSGQVPGAGELQLGAGMSFAE